MKMTSGSLTEILAEVALYGADVAMAFAAEACRISRTVVLKSVLVGIDSLLCMAFFPFGVLSVTGNYELFCLVYLFEMLIFLHCLCDNFQISF